LTDPGIEVRDTWHVLGMRGTGSHDIVIKDVLVPDSLRRPAGKWIPVFHLAACIIPLPLIYAVYLGIAEAARDVALALVRKRPIDAGLINFVGDLENELALARMAHRDMVDAAASCEQPGAETTNRIMIDLTLLGGAITRAMDKAMEVAGGSAFYRAAGLERLFRDAQGARFHRPQLRTQLAFTGRLALGLDLEA
jgi:acyl-CoA dehydrogenase